MVNIEITGVGSVPTPRSSDLSCSWLSTDRVPKSTTKTWPPLKDGKTKNTSNINNIQG